MASIAFELSFEKNPLPPFHGDTMGVGLYSSRKNSTRASLSSADFSMKVSFFHQARASLSLCSATKRKMPRAFK